MLYYNYMVTIRDDDDCYYNYYVLISCCSILRTMPHGKEHDLGFFRKYKVGRLITARQGQGLMI